MRGWQRFTQWTQAHRFLFDALGTAAFALVVITTGLTLQAGGGQAPLAWPLAVIAPLAWRRTHPAASAGAVYTVAFAHVQAGHPLIFPAASPAATETRATTDSACSSPPEHYSHRKSDEPVCRCPHRTSGTPPQIRRGQSSSWA